MFLHLLTTITLHAAPDPAALALIDRAIDRVGGAAALESIARARFDFITMWQRTTFDDRPYSDLPGYERHTDVRDYTIGAWRNTREFPTPAGWRTVVDIVSGDAAARDFGAGPTPLNVTYIDERDELFTYSPDRLLLVVRRASDLRLLSDTVIGGLPHARVAATLAGAPAVLFLRRADGLPAMLRLRRAHPNDFGLVPLGTMDIEVWYSNWSVLPGGIALPRQWDIARAGRPYRRLTVTSVVLNPEFAADSFAIPAPVREAYRATAVRPMHDVPLDSARFVHTDFVEFRTFGAPVGAVRVGGAWLLLEAGQAPLSAERSLEWLRQHAGGSVALVVVGNTQLGNGGVAHMARHGVPTVVAPAFAPLAARILDGHAVRARIDAAHSARWLRVGTDSVRVEPIDLPNARGALLVYVPAHRWLWAPLALSPLDRTIVMEHARSAGWTVDRLGILPALLSPP